jgi:beta-glucosidase
LYGEDVYVGYRYYDELELEPLFPFGHGLSYTTFELSSLNLKRDSETELEVNVSLKNIGSRAGAEVIQVYVSPVSPPIKRPVKELKEFAKVYLEAGSQELVKLNLDLVRATSFWDEKTSSWRSEADTYRILIGTSSRGKFLEGEFALKETIYWSGL